MTTRKDFLTMSICNVFYNAKGFIFQYLDTNIFVNVILGPYIIYSVSKSNVIKLSRLHS